MIRYLRQIKVNLTFIFSNWINFLKELLIIVIVYNNDNKIIFTFNNNEDEKNLILTINTFTNNR